MKAAVVRSFGEPLVIEERTDPEPGPGQGRIGLEASGLCHTDTHAAGRTKVVYETRPLETVNESIADVLDGRTKARIVFAM